MDEIFGPVVHALHDLTDLESKKTELREGETIECKESFNWANRSVYAKSMAALANHRGGCLIFGISDNPRTVVGLKGAGFESQDDAKMAEYLNSLFSPAIQFERRIYEVAGHRCGVLAIAPTTDPPIMAIKSGEDIKEGEIYFRYNARTEKIKYPEMRALLDRIRMQERAAWSDTLTRIARLGPEGIGIMDMAHGEIHGRSGNLLIDEALIPKLRFIKEGTFQEGGEPTLKLIGDVRPVSARDTPVALRLTDDPDAPAVREETLLAQYPLDYTVVIKEAKKRYSDFLANAKFHRVMQKAKKNRGLAFVRYLRPHRKGETTSVVFYSRSIFDELDQIYTRK